MDLHKVNPAIVLNYAMYCNEGILAGETPHTFENWYKIHTDMLADLHYDNVDGYPDQIGIDDDDSFDPQYEPQSFNELVALEIEQLTKELNESDDEAFEQRYKSAMSNDSHIRRESSNDTTNPEIYCNRPSFDDGLSYFSDSDNI